MLIYVLHKVCSGMVNLCGIVECTSSVRYPGYNMLSSWCRNVISYILLSFDTDLRVINEIVELRYMTYPLKETLRVGG